MVIIIIAVVQFEQFSKKQLTHTQKNNYYNSKIYNLYHFLHYLPLFISQLPHYCFYHFSGSVNLFWLQTDITQDIIKLLLLINKQQVSKMKPQTLKYLQKDQIGKVIATGLAMLYINKPQKPVKYLAQWLKQYSNNEKQMSRLVKSQKQKITAVHDYQKQVQVQNNKVKEEQKKISQEKQKYDQIKELIDNHQYHYDLLQETLPQFIQHKIKATGVYVCELTHPPKNITQQDNDQNAHLDTTAEKIIHYFGSSKSHKDIIINKILKTSEGVTSGAFTLLDEVPVPVLGQDGQQIPQPPKPKYVYVQNVAKNPSLFYFRIPKLGSYIAVPISCNQYLTQSNFDLALKQKQEYLKQLEEFQKTKKQELQQLNKQKEQLEKKILQLTEKNADANLIEQSKLQLTQVQNTIAQKQKQKIQQKQSQLTGNRRLFCLCADTLGKDRTITQSEIDFLVEITNYYRDAWEKKQKQILKNDILNHIEALKTIQNTPQSYKQSIENGIQLTQQQQKEVAAIQDEQKKTLRQLQLQVIKFRTVVQTNPFYVQSFLRLKRIRVVKYRQLIQNILYFLGYKKKDVNIPKRTTLNWRVVSDKLITEENFLKIFQYNPIGSKEGQYPSYSKVPSILQSIEKFSEEQIFKYNIALGAILFFMKKVLQIRQIDVQIRKAKYQGQKNSRDKILQQNRKIDQKLAEELQKHRSTLSEQDLANFNEHNWKQQFYSKNPLHEIPPQIVADKDDDI